MNNQIVVVGIAMAIGLIAGVLIDLPTQEDTAIETNHQAALQPEAPVAVPLSQAQSSATASTADIQRQSLSTPGSLLQRFNAVVASGPGFPQYFALYQLADSASVTDLPELVQLALRLEDSFLRFGFATVFLERFTYLDPNAALAFVQSNLPQMDSQSASLARIVYREWIRLDREAAIASLETITDERMKNYLTMAVLQDKQLISAENYQNLMSQLPQETQEAIRLRALQAQDPQVAFEEALQKTGPSRDTLLYGAIQRWARVNPEAAIEAIEALRGNQTIPETTRQQLLNYALSNWAQSDFDNAYRYAQLAGTNDNTITSVLTTLAQKDPQRALTLAQQYMDESGGPRYVWDSIVSSWASQDIKGLLNYIQVNGLEINRNTQQSLAYYYGQAYPAEALRWSETQGEEVVLSVANSIAANNFTLLEDYFNNLDSGSVKNKLVEVISRHKATTNPQTALQWLDGKQSLITKQEYENARRSILGQWVYSDPANFVNQIAKMSREDAEQYVPSLVGAWLGTDAAAAKAWVSNLTPGAVKDQALAQLSSGIAQTTSRMEDVFYYLEQIGDQDAQTRAAESIAYSWIANYPDSFNQLVRRFNLDRGKFETWLEQNNAYR